MQRVGGEHHAGQAQRRDQLRRRRDLTGGAGDLAVGEDQRSLRGKGAQHVRSGLVTHVVEAAPKRFAVQGHRAQARLRPFPVQVTRVAAKGGFKVGRVKRNQQIAQRVERRRAAEAGAEGVVQALTMDADKGDDALIRTRPGQDRKDGEEQQVRQGVPFALRPPRIGDVAQSGQQSPERTMATSVGRNAVSTSRFSAAPDPC
jgi:hypothetical protein